MSRLIYEIDDHPPLREAIGLGFQHYLTMFGSTVAIPLLLAESLGMAGDPVAVDFGVDLYSRYIWRGTDYGHSPSIQPSINESTAAADTALNPA